MRVIAIILLISIVTACTNEKSNSKYISNELVESNNMILNRIESINNFDSAIINKTYYPAKAKQLRINSQQLINVVEEQSFTVGVLKDTLHKFQDYLTMQVLNSSQIDENTLIGQLKEYFQFSKRIEEIDDMTKLIVINKLLVSELMVLEHLNNATYAGNFSFNWLNMTVIPAKERIKLGEKFTANIVIRTFDTLNIAPICIYSKVKSNDEIQFRHKANDPLIKLVNYDKPDTLFYDNVNKMYHYECIADRKGENKIVGFITIKQPVTGARLYYPFKQTYIVE
ncbi:MAG: hypothetical protein ABFS35_13375 [Bacteroidota bacterium]